ncbi:MAG TPA: FAD-binding oxidoreductase [Solirubrobacteraceae bacterium]|nr:FAD-binding oxidoreductase [Solirubrobacteraceae bacterium]
MRREQVFHGWGEPGAGPRIGPHALALLREGLGVSGDVVSAPVPPARVRLRAPAEAPGLRSRLEGAVGPAHVRSDDAIRLLRAAGKSYLDLLALRAGDAGEAPDLVVAPGSAAEIAAVLAACAQAGAAVVPFGGGTSVVGGVAGERGGFDAVVCLDLARLDGVRTVDATSRRAVAGAGMRLPELDHALGAHGLRLGHYPQSYEWATAGGCAATRSAGQASTGFGRFDDLVAAVRCVTPAGELAPLGAPGSAAGPDLTRLVLGSEGTLGVIAELTLRVRPVAAATRYEAWLVPSFADGCSALRALAQDEVAPDVARLSDTTETELTFTLGGLPRVLRGRRGDRCLLIAGWEGEPGAIAGRRAAAAHRVRGLRLGRGVGEGWATHRFDGPHLRDDLMDRGVLVETLETATTWARLDALHGRVREALADALAATPPLVGCHVSHLYPDGASLYFTVLAPQEAEDPAGQWRRAKRAAGDAIAAAGATITHHHAVGRDHGPWLGAEAGETGLAALRAVKAALDPAGIMNPGKLLGLDPSIVRG